MASNVAQIPSITFDAERHLYRVDGREVPSVTQCLRAAGLIDTTWFTDLGRWRGSAVHLACQLDDEGDLDEGDLDPRIVPHLAAYRDFKRDYTFIPDEIEQARYNATFGYVGTPDRVGRVMLGTNECPAIVDLKVGGSVPAYALQLAGYANLLPEPRKHLRLKVWLGPGRYNVHQYSPATFGADLNVFLSAVAITQWKRKENVA